MTTAKNIDNHICGGGFRIDITVLAEEDIFPIAEFLVVWVVWIFGGARPGVFDDEFAVVGGVEEAFALDAELFGCSGCEGCEDGEEGWDWNMLSDINCV